MRRTAARLRPALALVLLTWFAQLCLPVVHAAMMGSPRAPMAGWCGDPSRALEVVAGLPAEIRAALQPDWVGAEHLAGCAELCAKGAAPTPPLAAVTVVLRAAGLAPAATVPPPPRRQHEPGRMPPAQGPPARA